MAEGEGGSNGSDARVDALTGVLRPLLTALDGLQVAARRLQPLEIAPQAARVQDLEAPLRAGIAAYRAVDWPDHLATMSACLEEAVEMTCRAIDGLRTAADEGDHGIYAAYRALRHVPRALEALYPLTAGLAPVSRFFLEGDLAGDPGLQARLADVPRGRRNVGVMHADNDRKSRGGFSLYVPEYYDADTAWPLIMAMHGGTGHGRAFLWTWLKEARSRGAILVSPTARETTWSLMPPDIDSPNVDAMLDYVRQNWHVDKRRMLLTGMSDGGTFCYVSGLRRSSPFSHLAPVAASFHPFLLEILEDLAVDGRRIYLTHGRLDWMFNVDVARVAKASLEGAGAHVTYREIPDLGHTYPREENARILDWFLHDRAPAG